MDTKPTRSPQVLVPYTGPSADPEEQDVFLYLRPESNGVQVESTILRVVEHCGEYRRNLSLVYLANIPGQFVVDNHLIERYYQMQLTFAVHGKRLFTEFMRNEFTEYFAEEFSQAPIVGAFEALALLGLRPGELFDVWVADEDLLVIHGQTVKRYQGYYIVNYDIPALLHKNNRDTDLAVMLFRTNLGWQYFSRLAGEMEQALAERGLLENARHPRRLFHYSRGPFQQVIDGWCYLCSPNGELSGMGETSFEAYLQRHGVTPAEVQKLIRHPLAIFCDESGAAREDSVFQRTAGDRYPEALKKLSTMRAQVYLQP